MNQCLLAVLLACSVLGHSSKNFPVVDRRQSDDLVEQQRGIIKSAWIDFRKGQYADAKLKLEELKRIGSLQKSKRYAVKMLEAQLAANADSDYGRAIQLAHDALKIARDENDTGDQWKTLRQLGVFSNSKGRSLLALRYHLEALKVAQDMQDNRKVLFSKAELAKEYFNSGFNERANQLIDGIDQDFRNRATCKLALVRIRQYIKNGDYATAIAKLEKLFLGYGLLGQRIPYGATISLAEAYLGTQQLDKAREVFQRVLDDKTIMERAVVTNAKLGLARIDIRQGKFDASLKKLDELLAIEIAPKFRKKILNAKIRWAILTGEKKLARVLLNELSECEIQLRHERVADELQFLEQQAAFQKQLHEKKYSEKILKSNLDASRTNQILAFICFATIILGLILSYGFLLRKRIAEKDLNHQRGLLEQETRLNEELKAKIQARVDELQAQQSEQLRLVNQLNMKRRDEALGKLTGGVAHDFNNLITVIQNVNDVIAEQMGDELGEEMLELVNCSKRATQSASEITNRLLLFAKKQELQPEPIDLQKFFDEYLPLIQQSAGARNRLSLVIEDSPMIFADETQFLSALINLSANSSHALSNKEISPEVKIVVRQISYSDFQNEIREHRAKFATIENEKSDRTMVVVSVQDNGCGMSADQLACACDPFYSTKTEILGHQFGGTGLGLSVVKGFLEQSNAGMDIYSELGIGTTVRMIFERCRTGKKQVGESVRHIRPELDGIRIVLVDDNEMLLKTLSVTLQQMGFRVDSFSSGSLAQIHMKQTEYDLLLTDIRMPNSIDGLTLASWAIEKDPDLPIVLMTGFNEEQVSSELPIIQKPFQKEMLVDVMLKAISDCQRWSQKHG